VIRDEHAYVLGKIVFFFVSGEVIEATVVMVSNVDLVALSFRLSNHSANGLGT
jgi:hypothetical protein